MFEGLGNAVHLVAAVVWIGGLAVIVLAFRPSISRALPDEAARDAVQAPLQRRFFVLSVVSAALLLATGFMMMTSNRNFEGFGSYEGSWSKFLVVKHVLFVAMVGVLVLQRRARPAKVERDLVDVSLMLGIAVLVVTGLLTAVP